jgi:hypothetical protein
MKPALPPNPPSSNMADVRMEREDADVSASTMLTVLQFKCQEEANRF